jgi:hypothetical protein
MYPVRQIQHARAALNNNRGFTFIEVTIITVILGVMALMIVPRLSPVLGPGRANFALISTIIAKTFDDAYVNERINFIVVHLNQSDRESSGEPVESVLSRKNGISVVNMDQNGKYYDCPNRLLKYKEFSESFKFDEVILSTGERVTSGNVLIPVYPNARADDVIIHIMVNNDERHSVRIFKFKREPQLTADYRDFSTQP